MNKLIELEYNVDKTSEVELRAKFLKLFANQKLLKFIGLNKKCNLDHVKAFYCNLELTTIGFETRFKDRVVKFGYLDFTTYFDLKSEGSSLVVARST